MRYIFLFLLFASSGVAAQEKIQVFFDFGKDEPTDVSTAALERWIADNRDAVATRISGFCDSVDVADYNIGLASRRIASVLKILRSNNAAVRDSVVLAPKGENFALSADAAKNRRVDIFFAREKRIAKAANEKPVEAGLDDVPIKSKFKNVRPGDLVRIQNINFFLNSEIVVPESQPRLQELYQVMRDLPTLIIEIHGHICCNPNPFDTKLSYRRAMYIFNYLRKKGIPLNRLGYIGFGSSHPIFRIPENDAQERAANRRVEILVKDI